MATITTLYLDGQADDETEGKVKLNTTTTTVSPFSADEILVQIRRIEKRTFPKEEAMDFDLELKKRNTELIVVIDRSPPLEITASIVLEAQRQPPQSLLSLNSTQKQPFAAASSSSSNSASAPESLVVAYLLHARSAGVDLLHKICVAEKYRRKGIAGHLLQNLKTKLESQGCERVQLWVDWQRYGAIELYKSIGFKRTDGARDYYGPGRHGIKMVVELNWVW